MEKKQNDTQTLTGNAGGTHVTDGPLTMPVTNEAAPGLLLNEIDRRVVRVRPTATPIDQISRLGGSRRSGSMVVDYYSVDTRPDSASVSDVAESANKDCYGDCRLYDVKTDRNAAFSPTDTLLFPLNSSEEGADRGLKSLMGYVVDSKKGGPMTVAFINAPKDETGLRSVDPYDLIGTTVVRMGRAAGELDMQTPQFEALPVKASNNCQIFKAQVEQSTFVKLSNKETGWSFSDQEEVAIMDMRLGMEKSFLFGTKARITDPAKGDDVLFTEGIWSQAGEKHIIAAGDMTHASLVALMRKAFTGTCAGSTRKILVAGSGLIERLNNIDYTRSVSASETTTKWGIDFTELRSKFGTLYVVHSEVFDTCGHEDDGMVIDPEYITKYTHVPFKVEHLDLKKSGVRNVDALVITEASCLVLRHPKAHIRIITQ